MSTTEAELVWTTGDRMAKVRRLAGLEQSDLAEKLNVSRALVSKWERDVSEPSLRQACLWAEVCGVPLEWLSPRSAWKTDAELAGLLVSAA